HSSEQNIGAPDFIRCQILSIGLKNITAVEFFGDRLFVGEFFPSQVLIGDIVGDLIITRHARIALLQSADRPLDFVFLFQPAVGDALLTLLEIGAQFRFLLFSNGAVFVFTPVAAAQDVNHAILLLALNFHADRKSVV